MRMTVWTYPVYNLDDIFHNKIQAKIGYGNSGNAAFKKVSGKCDKSDVACMVRAYVRVIDFVIISPFFPIFKNVQVHGLEPGETPSNSASYQVPNYAQRS